MSSDSFSSEGEYKDGLCYDADYDSYTSENKGDYYEICVTDGGEGDCTDVYVLDRGAVFYEDGECDAIVSDISTPTYNASSDEAREWVDDFTEISHELEDEICIAETTTDGLELYNFDGRDGVGGSLVYIKMVAGDEPLNWAVVKISISVDGGMVMQCDEDGRDDNYSDCVYTISSEDNNWDLSEEITISEGENVDLCDGSCEVRVTIIKLGVGGEDDRIILTYIQIDTIDSLSFQSIV